MISIPWGGTVAKRIFVNWNFYIDRIIVLDSVCYNFINMQIDELERSNYFEKTI